MASFIQFVSGKQHTGSTGSSIWKVRVDDGGFMNHTPPLK